MIKSRLPAKLEREKSDNDGKFLWTIDKVDRLFNRIKQKCSFKDDKKCTFYSARHTFITRMLEIPKPLHEVRDLAGHIHISTTEHYITTNENRLADCTNALANHPASKRNSG